MYVARGTLSEYEDHDHWESRMTFSWFKLRKDLIPRYTQTHPHLMPRVQQAKKIFKADSIIDQPEDTFPEQDTTIDRDTSPRSGHERPPRKRVGFAVDEKRGSTPWDKGTAHLGREGEKMAGTKKRRKQVQKGQEWSASAHMTLRSHHK